MSAKSTRRAVLAGAATLPALSIPVSDGELSFTDLAARLADVRQRWIRQATLDANSLQKFEELVFAVTGIGEQPEPSDPRFEEYFEIRSRLATSDGEDPENTHRYELNWASSRKYPISRRNRSLTSAFNCRLSFWPNTAPGFATTM
jgi:hypothetical protein